MSKPFVRRADLDDARELARLRWDFRLEEGEQPSSLDSFTPAFASFFLAGMESGTWAVFVGQVGERLVANLWIEIVNKVATPDDPSGAWGYVTNVYTEPSFRGSGLGTQILETAIRWAALEKLELLIVWPSEGSVDFYRRAGFSANPMLLELNMEDGWWRKSRRIWVTDYDSAWPEMFGEEKKRILRAIGKWAAAIEHVGSTAVAGLGGKPIIDIMVGLHRLSDFKKCVLPLEEIGYEYAAWVADLPGRHYFRRSTADGVRTHHLHMVEAGSGFFEKHLMFRDYLRAHPQVAARYYELKKKLATLFEWDSIGYTEAKTEFIESALEGRSVDAPLEPPNSEGVRGLDKRAEARRGSADFDWGG